MALNLQGERANFGGNEERHNYGTDERRSHLPRCAFL